MLVSLETQVVRANDAKAGNIEHRAKVHKQVSQHCIILIVSTLAHASTRKLTQCIFYVKVTKLSS
jgi:hypothetical protein